MHPIPLRYRTSLIPIQPWNQQVKSRGKILKFLELLREAKVEEYKYMPHCVVTLLTAFLWKRAQGMLFQAANCLLVVVKISKNFGISQCL